MCFGGGGGNDAKEIQKRNEQLEKERQERIREGARRINEAFAQFTGSPERVEEGAPFPGFTPEEKGEFVFDPTRPLAGGPPVFVPGEEGELSRQQDRRSGAPTRPNALSPEEMEKRRQEWEAAHPDTVIPAVESTFFDDVKQSFLDFQEPQVNKQFNQARGDVTAALVDRGILESTEGIRAHTDLQDRDALVRTNLANQAADKANEVKSNLAREKSNLFALNETAADPARIGTVAQGAAQSFAAPQAFSPMENIFGSVLNNVAAFQAARNNAVAPTRRPTFSTAPVSNSPGGSGRVVR